MTNNLINQQKTSKKFKKITLMVPCYNEEKGIPEVIKGINVKELNQRR